jgi:hypothetical protein
MPTPRTHPLRTRLLGAAAALCLALGLAEICFRLIPPMGPEFLLAATTGTIENAIFRDDVALRVILAPRVDMSGFHTNAAGIRGPEIGTKRVDEQRVLTIGDSITLGLAVNDNQTFSAQLSASLGEAVTVYNAGVPGYGTEQATALLERLFPTVKPDAVLLTVYTGNDLRDNVRWAESPGLPSVPPPVVSAPPSPRASWLSSLAKHSRLVAYSLMFLDLSRASSDFRIQEFKDEILPFTDRDQLSPLMPPTRAALHRFADVCRTLQVPCGIALVPPAFVVHTERMERTFAAFDIQADDSHLNEPQRAIGTAAARTTPVLDLTEALREGADRRPYLIFDPHFSTEGHTIAAEALTPFVARLLASP